MKETVGTKTVTAPTALSRPEGDNGRRTDTLKSQETGVAGSTVDGRNFASKITVPFSFCVRSPRPAPNVNVERDGFKPPGGGRI